MLTNDLDDDDYGDERDGSGDSGDDDDTMRLPIPSAPYVSTAAPAAPASGAPAAAAPVVTTRGRSESTEPGAMSRFPTLDRLAATGTAPAVKPAPAPSTPPLAPAAAPNAVSAAAAAPATASAAAPVATTLGASAGVGAFPVPSKPVRPQAPPLPPIPPPPPSQPTLRPPPQLPTPFFQTARGVDGGGGQFDGQSSRQGQMAAVSVQFPLSSQRVSRFVGRVPIRMSVGDEDDGTGVSRRVAPRRVAPPEPMAIDEDEDDYGGNDGAAAAAAAAAGGGGGGRGGADGKTFLDGLIASSAAAAGGGGHDTRQTHSKKKKSQWMLDEVRAWVRATGGWSSNPELVRHYQPFEADGSNFRHVLFALCPGLVVRALEDARSAFHITTDGELLHYVLGHTLADNVWTSNDDLQRKRRVFLEYISKFIAVERARNVGQKTMVGAEFHSFRRGVTGGCGCILAK